MDNFTQINEEKRGLDSNRSLATNRILLGDFPNLSKQAWPVTQPQPEERHNSQANQGTKNSIANIELTAQRLETPRNSQGVPHIKRREEEDSYIHEIINTSPLKRKKTPIYELPKEDKDESKIQNLNE